MTLVYATGRPRNFEFATACCHPKLPADAVVLASCEGEHTTSLLDEQTFNRMSDEEYYELQGLISDARQGEVGRAVVEPTSTWLLEGLWKAVRGGRVQSSKQNRA
ncbi:MAG TPA: hypothetical protein VIQ24_09495 [Pyrinomonadaceae bacterium]